VDLIRYGLDKTPTLLILHCLGGTRGGRRRRREFKWRRRRRRRREV